jgi:lipopolysaccharide/colanic/teichoic acid biosynthesis glycosyltransferase
MKNIIDFIISLLGIILLAPFLVIIGLIILFAFGSPIFFIQSRPGFLGKPFKFFKYRTMTNKKDKNGNLLPDKNRLSPLGSFLRKTSLDELPSLWNVLKCDMSLVGPRPLLMEYLPLYSEEQMRRQEVKPGITGWAQINGRNAITWEEKFKLDVWYVDNRSLFLDLKILLLTIWKVFTREGISPKGRSTMEKFNG